MRRLLVGVAMITFAAPAVAQDPGMNLPAFDAKRGGSEKVHMLGHVPSHAGAWKAADLEMEQDPGRPYVYLCGFTNFDVQIYDVRDAGSPGTGDSFAIDADGFHRSGVLTGGNLSIRFTP